MRLTGLSVRDFRSWQSLDLVLQPGVTVFLGANGQGKTNLVEAINFVATLGSHRVATDAPLIRRDCARALVQVGVLDESVAEKAVKIELNLVPRGSCGAAVNGVRATRARDILGLLRTVLFAPEDLDLVKGDPGGRRRFIDELVVARSPRFAAVMADYSRILRQRASLLRSAPAAARSAASRESLQATLDAWDEQAATVGARLTAARLQTLDMLRGPAVERLHWLTSAGSALSLDYQAYNATTATAVVAGTTPDEATLAAAIHEDLHLRRDDELRRGVVLVGPQRDDIHIGLGDLPAKGYASHGESWSIALALRLASFDLLREQAGSDPVLLLDDVFAELDSVRREKLTEAIEGVEQVIITAAVREDVPQRLLSRCLPISGSGSEVSGGDA